MYVYICIYIYTYIYIYICYIYIHIYTYIYIDDNIKFNARHLLGVLQNWFYNRSSSKVNPLFSLTLVMACSKF